MWRSRRPWLITALPSTNRVDDKGMAPILDSRVVGLENGVYWRNRCVAIPLASDLRYDLPRRATQTHEGVETMAVSFKGAHFPPEVILMGIRWYRAYPLSTRDVEGKFLNQAIGRHSGRAVLQLDSSITPLSGDSAAQLTDTPRFATKPHPIR